MNSDEKLVPELRFPEFENDGEWRESKLEAIGEPLMCKRIFKEQTTGNPKNGIPFYKIGTFGRVPDSYISYELFNEYKSKFSFPKIGDILISAAGTIGRLVVYDGAPAYFQDSNIVWLKNNEKVLLNSFLFYCYSTIEWQTSDGGVISRLYNSDLKNMSILFPKEENEQQKIAFCLSSLDELISAHTDKLEALKDHKKGLMRILFPQEGQSVPKHRFAEFQNEGDWINASVEQLIKENVLFAPKDGNHGNSHPKSVDYVKNGIPFIMASDLKNGEIDFLKCAYLTREQADSLQKGFAQSGDVLLTHKGTVGDVALIGDVKFPYLMLSPQVTYYRIKDVTKMSNIYLATYLNSSKFQDSLLKVSGGGTRAYVGITEQQNLEIKYPNRIEEQQKIASFFFSLDSLIIAQAEKIKQLQSHKKGLMQKLFPKAD